MSLPNRMRRALVPAVALLVGACASLASAAAEEAPPAPSAGPAVSRPVQVTPDTGFFVVRMGTDTLAVERYVRRGNRLQGELVVRSPQTALRRYDATLRADGSIQRFEASFMPAPGGTGTTTRAVADLRDRDTAVVTITQGDSVRTLRVATAAPAIPSVGSSYALVEQAMVHARATRADSVGLVLLPLGGTRTSPLTLQRQGVDSMLVSNIAGTSRARVDGRGLLLGLDGAESTQKVTVERVPALDLAALAAAFAARDAQGQAVGTLSPRDSASAMVGGATVLVDYGRPAARGRTIWGEVVPWNRAWRTGANAATQLRTDRPLRIGDAEVPAGTYTLFTLPSQDGWKLIVNRQTGQWGTEYDERQDLARVDLRTERLDTPVERFTISVEPRGDGGILALAWGDTRAWVPVEVR